jgi:hypothetical protein
VSIRIRVVDGVMVALCAARSVEKLGDIYLDDAAHHALAEKFAADFQSEGYNTHPYDAHATAIREREESNNPNRDWWDTQYAHEAGN